MLASSALFPLSPMTLGFVWMLLLEHRGCVQLVLLARTVLMDNNQKLIASLRDQKDRRAHYVCALVLVRNATDAKPLIVETRWDGEIIDAPRGVNGFGYDPYFFLPELSKTAAELSPEHKNQISHRGQALRTLMSQLQNPSFFTSNA